MIIYTSVYLYVLVQLVYRSFNYEDNSLLNRNIDLISNQSSTKGSGGQNWYMTLVTAVANKDAYLPELSRAASYNTFEDTGGRISLVVSVRNNRTIRRYD